MSRRDVLHRAARVVADNFWGNRGARIGLGARGVVYLIFAYLVVRVALGALGHAPTSKPASGPGVAQAIAAEPGGRVALLLLGVAVLLYGVFGAIDTVLHHDTERPAARRWGDRLLSAWGIVVYGAFGVYCFVTAASSRAGKQNARQGDRRQSQWSAEVLRWPVGWLYLGVLGAALIVIAVFLLSRCVRGSFRSWLEREEMGTRTWRFAVTLGTIGYLGRAGVFAIVGWFVLSAAIENDPDKGQGVDGSVRRFADSAAGPYLLWVLAAALAAYGIYTFLEARYREV
jgi:hypothetical protein